MILELALSFVFETKLSGRVTNGTRGVSGAVVTACGNEARTNPFGYWRMSVPCSENEITARHKSIMLTPEAIYLSGDAENVNFYAAVCQCPFRE